VIVKISCRVELSVKMMNASEKKFVKVAQKMLVFESGLAISERPQSRIAEVHRWMIHEYTTRLEDFDPTMDENIEAFTSPYYILRCREEMVDIMKQAMQFNSSDGKKLWNIFANMKSEFVNHWLPHYELKSGENVNDAMERVRKHIWAYRANRAIKKNNRRIEGNSEGTVLLKQWDEAPDGSMANILLEMPTFIKHHTHPFISVLSRSRGECDVSIGEDSSVHATTSSIARSVTSSSATGSIARLVDSVRVQKRKKSTWQSQSQSPSPKKTGRIETYDLNQLRKTQSMAALAHTKAMADKNKIDFLRLALESNIFTAEKIRDMFTAAASDILPTSTGRTDTSDRMGDNRIDSIEIDDDDSLDNGPNEDDIEAEDLDNTLDQRINEAIRQKNNESSDVPEKERQTDTQVNINENDDESESSQDDGSEKSQKLCRLVVSIP